MSFSEVMQAYEGRAYHNLEHLEECLAWLDCLPLPSEQLQQLRVALIYHDAVYDPRRSDNEQASADWAERDGYQVSELILATRHTGEAHTGLSAWMVDIDLSILGSEPERFERYNRDIRREYAWVSAADYRAGRGAVLRSFLERPAIYATSWFRERLECRARANLQAAVQQLAVSPDPGSG